MKGILIALIVASLLTVFGPSALKADGDEPPGNGAVLMHIAGDEPPGNG